MWGLYDRLKLHRIYFSAYQKGLGDASLPLEQAGEGGEGVPPLRLAGILPARKEQAQGVPNAELCIGEPHDALVTHLSDMFVREHRLYQVDFLMRKYGFTDTDILFDEQGHLSLEADPKEVWAARHPEFFPVEVNRASRLELLRVPGLGPITADRILKLRRTQRIGRLEDIASPGRRLKKAGQYLAF